MHRFASVILVDRRGWLLLQERDDQPLIDPGKWGLVGGHVEPGESYEVAAYRELQEETGILLAPGSLALWRELEVFHEAYDSLDRVQVWVGATSLIDADIVVGEGRQIVFVSPARVRRLDHTASAALILPAFLGSDSYRRLVEWM
jgi:8-oxo-dGTP pyrophosphatase MutT (NUDIX family)